MSEDAIIKPGGSTSLTASQTVAAERREANVCVERCVEYERVFWLIRNILFEVDHLNGKPKLVSSIVSCDELDTSPQTEDNPLKGLRRYLDKMEAKSNPQTP